MSLTPNEPQQEFIVGQIPKRSPVRTIKTKNKLPYKLLILISIVLWGSLLYGGYFFTNKYINNSNAYIVTKADQIEAQNQKQLETFTMLQTQLDKLHEELVNVQNYLQIIQDDLTLTGKAINGTDETKQGIQQRIDELNIQLNELQSLILRLEDATVN